MKVERQAASFHVWMDEIRQKSYEDRNNLHIVGKGYTDYCTIQDMPIRGLPTYLHMRKCKWLDKDIGEIFSYDIDYYEEEGTRLSAEIVAFLKGEDRVRGSGHQDDWTYLRHERQDAGRPV